MNAEEILNAAQMQGYTFLGPQKISTTALLSHLSNLDIEITKMAIQIAPQMLTEGRRTLDVTMELNRNGYALKDAIAYRDFVYEGKHDNRTRIRIVPQDQLDAATSHPSGVVEKRAHIEGDRFFPVDHLHKGWAGDQNRSWFQEGSKIHYKYIPQPGRLEKLNDTLTSPREAFNYFVQALVTQIQLIQRAPQADLEISLAREQEYKSSLLMLMYKRVKIESRAFEDRRSQFIVRDQLWRSLLVG